MKIAIIGAGGAGLCAGRHSLKANLSIDIFEQTGNVGGTWNYTDRIGLDENNIPVHSSMYKGLRTNLPKELMSYEDFPYPDLNESYISQQEVIDYIQSYSKFFQIEPHVKFHKRVLLVEPQNELWLVVVEDVKNKQKNTRFYNGVVVCNGHNKEPFIPEIPGIDGFSGRVKHSHDYRSPESYKNKKVLVLGAGPSGCDIAQQISEVATKVYVSHRSTLFLSLNHRIQQKPLLLKVEGNTAVFEDATSEQIEEVLYCTGYKFVFPFLSKKCGVTVTENYVHPLYKQIVNIENPTMGFIGLPITVCPFPVFDIQVRFFLSTLTGHFKLPSRDVMRKNLDETISKIASRPMKKYHQLGEAQGEYFDDLAKTANIKPMPPVIQKLYMRVRMNRNLNDRFRIIDDETFEQIL